MLLSIYRTSRLLCFLLMSDTGLYTMYIRSGNRRNCFCFRFPLKNTELTKRWVTAMRRDNWYPTQASRICSTHFLEKDMYKVNTQRRLLASAVPSIFSFPVHLQRKQVERRPPRKRSLDETCNVGNIEAPSKQCEYVAWLPVNILYMYNFI